MCAQYLVAASIVNTRGLAIIDEANKFNAGIFGLANFAGQGQTLIVHADNDGPFWRALYFDQQRGDGPQKQAGAKFRQRADPQPVGNNRSGKLVDVV